MQHKATLPSWCLTGLVIGACSLPLVLLATQLARGQLGPDPAERLMQDTGEWALRGLALVLLASPLARAGWRGVFRYRRILGVSVFLYVSLHLLHLWGHRPARPPPPAIVQRRPQAHEPVRPQQSRNFQGGSWDATRLRVKPESRQEFAIDRHHHAH